MIPFGEAEIVTRDSLASIAQKLHAVSFPFRQRLAAYEKIAQSMKLGVTSSSNELQQGPRNTTYVDCLNSTKDMLTVEYLKTKSFDFLLKLYKYAGEQVFWVSPDAAREANIEPDEDLAQLAFVVGIDTTDSASLYFEALYIRNNELHVCISIAEADSLEKQQPTEGDSSNNAVLLLINFLFAFVLVLITGITAIVNFFKSQGESIANVHRDSRRLMLLGLVNLCFCALGIVVIVGIMGNRFEDHSETWGFTLASLTSAFQTLASLLLVAFFVIGAIPKKSNVTAHPVVLYGLPVVGTGSIWYLFAYFDFYAGGVYSSLHGYYHASGDLDLPMLELFLAPAFLVPSVAILVMAGRKTHPDQKLGLVTGVAFLFMQMIASLPVFMKTFLVEAIVAYSHMSALIVIAVLSYFYIPLVEEDLGMGAVNRHIVSLKSDMGRRLGQISQLRAAHRKAL